VSLNIEEARLRAGDARYRAAPQRNYLHEQLTLATDRVADAFLTHDQGSSAQAGACGLFA